MDWIQTHKLLIDSKVFYRQIIAAPFCIKLVIHKLTLPWHLLIVSGYIYANKVSESIVGISMALSGFMGIVGTGLFTRLHKRIGLERTGMIAINSEILCLVLCVVSIWMPGSRFDPYFASRPPRPACNASSDLLLTSEDAFFSQVNTSSNDSLMSTHKPSTDQSTEYQLSLSTEYQLSSYSNDVIVNEFLNYSTSQLACSDDKVYINISIILLLTGIICSRVGEYHPAPLIVVLTVEPHETGC